MWNLLNTQKFKYPRYPETRLQTRKGSSKNIRAISTVLNSQTFKLLRRYPTKWTDWTAKERNTGMSHTKNRDLTCQRLLKLPKYSIFICHWQIPRRCAGWCLQKKRISWEKVKKIISRKISEVFEFCKTVENSNASGRILRIELTVARPCANERNTKMF